MELKKNKAKVKPAPFTVLLILSIISCSLLLLPGCAKEKELTCVKENVSYIDTETYTEGTLEYSLGNFNKGTNRNTTHQWMKAYATVQNTDTQAGNFTVQMTFTLINGTVNTVNSTLEIKTGESRKFGLSSDVDELEREDEIGVSGFVFPPPKMHVRNVTRYRMEERCY